MNKFSTELKNVMVPDYINQLGMSKAPFSEFYEPQNYFENDNNTNMQKKIAHLLEYTNLILFVQGSEGVGKTTILKQRLFTAKQDWAAGYLSAKDYNTSETLISKLADEFKLDLSNNPASAEVLQDKFDTLNKAGKLPVLIIDDVEQLSNSVTQLLSTLILPNNNDRPVLRLIIAGTDIPQSLRQSIPKENDEDSLKYLPVSALTEKETDAYLTFKIQTAGYTKTTPFNATIVKKIYQDSKGFPKIINQLANHTLSQYAQGEMVKPPIVQTGKNNSGLKLSAIILSVLVIAIIISINMSEDNSKQAHQETEILAIPATTSIKQTETTQQKKPDSEPAGLDEKQAVSSIQKQSTKTEIEDQKIITTSAPAKETPKITAVKTDKKNWIEKQNPKYFTLQLIGSSKEKSAENFIKKHKLENDAHIFSTVRNDKPWFSVIYKSYPQRKDAQAAIKSLPATLKNLKPWIRTFAHIKRDMK